MPIGKFARLLKLLLAPDELDDELADDDEVDVLEELLEEELVEEELLEEELDVVLEELLSGFELSPPQAARKKQKFNVSANGNNLFKNI